MPIRIVIADDHPMMRAGLAAVIANEPDLEVVGEAHDGREAIECARTLAPDVILMDLGMPEIGGVQAIRAILSAPDADAPPRIIALTVYAGDADIRRALDAGAAGYLLKDMAGTQVVDAIREAVRGRRVLPPPVEAQLTEFTSHVELTARELEVLALVAEGHRNRAIAEQLDRSEETVKMHVKSVLAKLGAADRTEAVAIAIRRGILHTH